MSRLLGRKPYHIAHVLPDLETAVDRLIATGHGPFHYFHSIEVPMLHRGQKGSVRLSVAFACIGGMLTEFLVQENDTPSAYREFLATNPGGGLHHIAYLSDDFTADLKRAAANGTDLAAVQEFVDGAGVPYEVYYEPVGRPDAVMIQLALPGPLDAAFAEIRRISEDWDGTAPKRSLLDLLPPEFAQAL